MLNRVITTLKEIHHHSDFERYLENVQRTHRTGVPTVQEARRDYQAIAKRDFLPLDLILQ